MYPEFQLREEHFLVLEISQDFIKAGQADPFSLPSITLPLKALPNENGVIFGEGSSPLDKEGHIQNWDLFEAICKHVLFRLLKLKRSRNHSPIVLSIPHNWVRDDKERIVQIFFEKFNVPGLYITELPLMVLYGFGHHLNGIICYFNNNYISLIPIIETQIQNHSVLRMEYGLEDLRKYLKSLLQNDSQFKKETAGLELNQEFLDFLIKNVCEVSLLPLDTESHAKGKKEKEVARSTFTYKDKEYSIGEAKFKTLEALFTPKLLGKSETRSLPEILYEVLALSFAEKRTSLSDNIVFAGAICQFKGLKARLEKAMEKYLAFSEFANETQPKEIKFGKMVEYIEQLKGKTEMASWLGASIVAKLVFPDMKNYITKVDYNESGPAVVRSKCY